MGASAAAAAWTEEPPAERMHTSGADADADGPDEAEPPDGALRYRAMVPTSASPPDLPPAAPAAAGAGGADGAPPAGAADDGDGSTEEEQI